MRFLFTLILSFHLIACKGPAMMTAEHPTYISFGSLGGFAGSYTEYRIVPDGHAYKRTKHKGDFIQLESIDKGQTKQFFKLLEEMKVQDVKSDDPGNMTYFLSLHKSGDTESLELAWGGGNKSLDPRIKILYKSLKALAKDKAIVR